MAPPSLVSEGEDKGERERERGERGKGREGQGERERESKNASIYLTNTYLNHLLQTCGWSTFRRRSCFPVEILPWLVGYTGEP